MTTLMDSLSEAFETSPTAVLEPPSFLSTTAETPQLQAGFWRKSMQRGHFMAGEPQDVYALLTFHFDHEFALDLNVNGDNVYRGNALPANYTLIPPGVGATAEMNGEFDVLQMLIPAHMANTILPQSLQGVASYGKTRGIHKRLKDLRHWQRNGTQSDQQKLAGYGALLQIAGQLMTSLSPLDRGERLTTRDVRRAFDIMRARIQDMPKVSHIATELDMSESHFARAFRNTTGQTPGEAIRKIRMEKARRLLEDDTLGILDLAAAVGYADPSHFAQVFKEEFGLSPARWRRQHNR